MCLRHQSDDLTSVQDCCHIIQFAMISKRSANKDQGIHICCFFCNLQQSFPCTVQKPSLQEQILAGVTSDTKFRKNHNFDMFFFHFADKSDDFISICITVCNCDIWCCGCCFDITVSHFLPLFFIRCILYNSQNLRIRFHFYLHLRRISFSSSTVNS